MLFSSTLTPVANRGVPPRAFLETIVNWGRSAPAEIFAYNDSPRDIYAAVVGELGPFAESAGADGQLRRRAVMLEVMRVHAGFESSWNWNEGVDATNARSLAHIEGQESGIFQVSFDSVWLGHSALLPFARECGIDGPEKFIPAMKCDPGASAAKPGHNLALEYYARLVRVSIAWAGPLKNGAVNQWLKREAVAEFEALLKGI